MEYRLQWPSAAYRLSFNGVLPALPVPLTGAFGELCRALEPFGLTADGVTFRNVLAANLSDAAMECSLLQGRAVLKLTYGWFELVLNSLIESDLLLIPALLESAFGAALGEHRSLLERTSTRIVYSSHLELADQGAVDGFFTSHLDPGAGSGLKPDAFACTVDLNGDRAALEAARVVFARSLRLTNGIYAEFQVDYEYPAAASVTVSRTREIVDSTLSRMGFEQRPDEVRPIEEVRP